MNSNDYLTLKSEKLFYWYKSKKIKIKMSTTFAFVSQPKRQLWIKYSDSIKQKVRFRTRIKR